MKIYIILLLHFFLFSVSCQGQETESIKLAQEKDKSYFNKKNDSIAMNFDLEKYEKNLKENPLYEGFLNNKGIYIRQYHLIKDDYIEESYTKDLVTNYVEEWINDNGIKTVKIFDKTGSLELVKYYFGDDLETGEWLYYKNKNLFKIENKDENFKYSLDEVLRYGKEHGVDFTKTGKIKKSYSSASHNYLWVLEWNTGKMLNEEEYIFKQVIINASNRKVISSKEYPLNPLQRD